ncbi:WXG100 family type VII secretion target [Aeromicrobium fastidiosum]|uniref:Putative T7SS secretion signal domain-containing protein n=1 Tax=Aeromicrobium fastidiosum TaxID=52699 RepID=A0A641AME4_9ACTN|nr:hypothetical protein [Aeromicrobium fastidiosum]KAA1378299.1 hypothetical protein ESP62_007950 [Aeromicrobium fastidiosum]MBP2388881.1 uncharacterized protein YukE [Aeromicrobium fastidiosum]
MSSRRTAEWHLVGRDRDPVPADMADVEHVAKDFKDRGTVMNEAADTLKSLAGLDGWTGDAAKKFAEKADEAHGDLAKAADKYTGAATALYTFADDVDTARTKTWTAVKAAEQAKRDQDANQGSLLDGVDDPTDAQKEADKQRGKDREAAASALGQARTDLDNAMDDLATAASNAAARINKASEKFKDSKMDNIKGFVAAAIDVLNVIAIVILAVVIVILIVATCGGFLGVVLAAGGIIGTLMTIGTVVGAAIFALTFVQMLMGEASFGDLLISSLGVIGGPIGKLGGKLAAPALARMTTLARTSAELGARGSLSYRIAGAVQRIPIGPLRTGLREFQQGLVDDAIRAVDDRLVSVATKPRPIGVVTGFDGATEMLGNLRALTNMADQLPADVSAIRRAIAVHTAGGTATFAGQGNDIKGFGESLGNTLDNLQNLPDVFTIEAPDRPTTIVPVGR